MNAHPVTSLTINKGTCYAVFAYDIGWLINLEDVNRRITADRERSRLSTWKPGMRAFSASWRRWKASTTNCRRARPRAAWKCLNGSSSC
jgi:hypothetical protein